MASFLTMLCGTLWPIRRNSNLEASADWPSCGAGPGVHAQRGSEEPSLTTTLNCRKFTVEGSAAGLGAAASAASGRAVPAALALRRGSPNGSRRRLALPDADPHGALRSMMFATSLLKQARCVEAAYCQDVKAGGGTASTRLKSEYQVPSNAVVICGRRSYWVDSAFDENCSLKKPRIVARHGSIDQFEWVVS